MRKELSRTLGEKEAVSVADILLYQLGGIDRLEVIRDPGRELPGEKLEILRSAIDRIRSSEPVQYVTGRSQFHGLELVVNNNVLIPRPETEELVDWVIRENKGRKGLRMIDIGTGSGCIALALSNELVDGDILAIDISEDALKVARINADRLGSKITLLCADITCKEETSRLGVYDLVVSNPPYVRISEKSGMDRNVLEHEPNIALFVKDEDPLLHYRAILDFMQDHMEENGIAYLEINEGLGKEVSKLFTSAGYASVNLRMDMSGKDRMVRVSRRIAPGGAF